MRPRWTTLARSGGLDVRGGEVRLPQCLDGSFIGWAGHQRVQQPFLYSALVVEDHLVLGREVTEEGPRRGSRCGGDVIDRHGVESSLGEQSHCDAADFVAQESAAALGQLFGHTRSPRANSPAPRISLGTISAIDVLLSGTPAAPTSRACVPSRITPSLNSASTS